MGKKQSNPHVASIFAQYRQSLPLVGMTTAVWGDGPGLDDASTVWGTSDSEPESAADAELAPDLLQ